MSHHQGKLVRAMKPSLALEANREAVRALVTKYRTANPRVFGSVVRGEDTDDSDVDILVDPLPGMTLLDLGGLHYELEDLLGVKVDIVTSRAMRKRILDRVVAEALPL